MAGSQGNGSTILLGLKGHDIGDVIEEEKGIVIDVRIESRTPACPSCSSLELYRHGRATKRRILHAWSHDRRIYTEIARQC